jgi:hypothetical protein
MATTAILDLMVQWIIIFLTFMLSPEVTRTQTSAGSPVLGDPARCVSMTGPRLHKCVKYSERFSVRDEPWLLRSVLHDRALQFSAIGPLASSKLHLPATAATDPHQPFVHRPPMPRQLSFCSVHCPPSVWPCSTDAGIDVRFKSFSRSQRSTVPDASCVAAPVLSFASRSPLLVPLSLSVVRLVASISSLAA